MSRVFLRRALVVSLAAALAMAAACVAPADLDVDVGRSVHVQFDATKAAIEPEEIVEAIKGYGQVEDVRVRAIRKGEQVFLDLDVWGRGLPEGPLAPRLKADVPDLKEAQITEDYLRGKVRGTLGKKLGHDLLAIDVIDTADVEVARRQVMDQLAARGVTGKVDVKVEGDGDRRKVMIRVEKEGSQPPEEQPPPEEEWTEPVEP